MRTGSACATCGYPASGPGGVEHCYLYEHCERCTNDTDPCRVTQAIRADVSGGGHDGGRFFDRS